MNMTPRVFKTPIPDEVALEFFKPLGVSSLSSQMWVFRDIFTPKLCSELQELVTTIEPYYQNHQKHYATREFTVNGYIQILRHICKSRGWVLQAKEIGRKKSTAYRLCADTPATFDVCFE
jgi:hypothetical protein